MKIEVEEIIVNGIIENVLREIEDKKQINFRNIK